MENNYYNKFSTLCVHAGEKRDIQGAIHSPLYNHSTFAFETTKDLLDVVEGRKQGNLYTRYGLNPTIKAAEEKLAALEYGEAALVFGSGMAAEAATFLTYAHNGDEIICIGDVYGGTFELLQKLFPQVGITTKFLLGSEMGFLESSINLKTKMIFFETPTNPNMEIIDIESVGKTAHDHNVLVVVDNTFASPYNQNPLRLNADLVIHSTTKYLGGHSDLTGGVVIGSGKIVEPIGLWRKGLGQIMAPDVAYLLLRSLRTLAVRVERQNKTAMSIAQALQKHPAVKSVNYPGLETFPGHSLAVKQMRGFGGMVSFEIIGDRKATEKFVDSLILFSIAPSLGGVESLVTQPVTTTHHDLSSEERARRGISDSLVRISCGLEDEQDLINDLEHALETLN
ncbi:MAG: aminotransferase class I/II-fold pyridoxal phosphate-dependent enzyme [Candidatus Latescibacter sp.]|nr:aminotransferase class I/II-fold pyridoxal phosphate-dependent enzyme [Candidatus Latescibacter sp.]